MQAHTDTCTFLHGSTEVTAIGHTEALVADELDKIREALGRVTALLRGGAPTSPREEGADESWEVPGQGRWSRDDLTWLADRIDARPLAAAVADMSAVAAKSGTTVTWPEVLAETGAPDDNRSRSHLGQLTVWSKERFAGARRWPFEAWQSMASEGRMTYRMPPGLAAAWRELRGL